MTHKFRTLKTTFYYNNALWYNITADDQVKLLKKKSTNGYAFKTFIVVDITDNERIYSRDEFLKKFCKENEQPEVILNILDSLRFKVFKKIKLKDLNEKGSYL